MATFYGYKQKKAGKTKSANNSTIQIYSQNPIIILIINA